MATLYQNDILSKKVTQFLLLPQRVSGLGREKNWFTEAFSWFLYSPVASTTYSTQLFPQGILSGHFSFVTSIIWPETNDTKPKFRLFFRFTIDFNGSPQDLDLSLVHSVGGVVFQEAGHVVGRQIRVVDRHHTGQVRPCTFLQNILKTRSNRQF